MLEALPPHFEYLGSAQDYAADIHEIFTSAPLFEPPDLAETTLLCNFMAVYSAHKNTTLLCQDESPSYMIILLTGSAKALRDNADGKRTWLHDLGPGQIGRHPLGGVRIHHRIFHSDARHRRIPAVREQADAAFQVEPEEGQALVAIHAGESLPFMLRVGRWQLFRWFL